MTKSKNSLPKRKFRWSEVEESLSRKNFYDVYKRHNFPEGEWDANRLIGDALRLEIHWIPVLKKDKGETAFPVICPTYADPNKDCPLCEVGFKRRVIYLTNAINRTLQDEKPAKAKLPPKGTKFIKPDDKFWSPVVVLQFPESVATKIRNLTLLNKVKDKKTGKVVVKELSDPKYGCDILVLFDSSQQGSGMYDIQKGDRTPLTKEELAYPVYDLDKVFEHTFPYDELLNTLKKAYDNELLDSDMCDLKAVRKLILKGTKQGKKNVEEDDEIPKETDKFDDEDIEEDEEGTFDDDDEVPEDEFDEEDDEIEEDEETPFDEEEKEETFDEDEDEGEFEEDEFDEDELEDEFDEDESLTLEEALNEMDRKEILKFIKSNKKLIKILKVPPKKLLKLKKERLVELLIDKAEDYLDVDDNKVIFLQD